MPLLPVCLIEPLWVEFSALVHTLEVHPERMIRFGFRERRGDRVTVLSHGVEVAVVVAHPLLGQRRSEIRVVQRPHRTQIPVDTYRAQNVEGHAVSAV